MAFIPQGQAGLAQALAMMQQPGGAPPQQQFQAQQQLPQPMQPAAGYVDPATIQRRQQLADMLRANAQRGGNPRTGMEAVGNLAQTLSAAWIDRRANKATERNAEASRTALRDALAQTDPGLRAKMLSENPDEKVRNLGLSQMISGGDETFGVSPQLVRGEDGKVRAVQFGTKGGRREQPIEGTPVQVQHRDEALSQGRDRIGLGYYGLDPELKAAQSEATAYGAEIGGARGAGEAALPGAEFDAAQTLDLIRQAKTHPGLEGSYGASTYIPPLRGSPRADFEVLREQMRGGAFMTAFQKLKGAGAITQVEGIKGEQAIARFLDQRQSTKAALSALEEYERIVRKGFEVAKQKAGKPAPTNQQPAASSSSAFEDAEKERRYQEWKARQK